MKVGFSRRAKRDLEEIFDYIAADNPEAAKRVRRAILDTVELIATIVHIRHSARQPWPGR
jgi:plasmid stabilization system protein ParE